MNVQMLDIEGVNNNFYRDFERNCEETDEQPAMALDLPTQGRIYMSSAWLRDWFELAIS